MSATVSSPARFRGVAVAAFTAALAVTAHGVADHAVPGGGAIALLAVVAAGLGAIVGTSDRAARPAVLLGALATGQLGGHLVLAAGTHIHQPAPGPTALPMLLAHAVAVVAGAVLVAAAERLYATLSTVLHAAARPPHTHVATRAAAALPHIDHPFRRALLIAASISHRGPPAAAAC